MSICRAGLSRSTCLDPKKGTHQESASGSFLKPELVIPYLSHQQVVGRKLSAGTALMYAAAGGHAALGSEGGCDGGLGRTGPYMSLWAGETPPSCVLFLLSFFFLGGG